MNRQFFSIGMKGCILAVFIVICGFDAAAQRGWEVGGWAGTTVYFGDLNTNFDLGLPGPAGGAIFRYNFNARTSIKLTANYGIVRADDARSSNPYERARNLSFRSSVFEISPHFEFNFLPYIHGSNDDFYTPYLFAGFTVFSFNPKAEYLDEWVELRPLGTEGQFKGEEYFTVQGGMAYGIGFKFDLSEVWSMNFELGGRYLFTDYLDDVSTVYPDVSDLQKLRGDVAVALSDRSISVAGIEDPIGVAGRQRGNRSNNDSYVFLGVGLVYYFGNLRCPDYGQ